MGDTYSVYKHTNVINGKVYIGITVNEPVVRWGRNGDGYSTQYFGIAIKKYGWENFKHEILFENLSAKEASQKEIELIKEYDATNSEKGYNIAKGGLTGDVRHPKTVYQYSLDGKFIKEYPSLSQAAYENNTKHSIIGNACRSGINHKSINYRWSYEYLGEQVAWDLMRNNNFYQEVYCYDLDGNYLRRYETVTEAQDDTGIDNSAICGCYKGKTSNTKGLRWFTEYQGDKIEPLNYCVNKKGQIVKAFELRDLKLRPIYQYDSEGIYIAKYDSARIAAEALNFNNLNNACIASERYGYKTYGFYWSYNYYENGFKPIKNKPKNGKRNKQFTQTPVYSYDDKGRYVRDYLSLEDAANAVGGKIYTLYKCCKNNRMSKGYYWSFKKESVKNDIHINPQQRVNKYVQYDLDHNLIAEYLCPQDAMEALNVRSINFKSKTSRGYIWEVIPLDKGESV